MEDLPGSSLLTTVAHKTLSVTILPRGVNLCRRNAASMTALESAEWFDSGVLSGADIQKSRSLGIVMLAGKYGILDKKLAGN